MWTVAYCPTVSCTKISVKKQKESKIQKRYINENGVKTWDFSPVWTPSHGKYIIGASTY